MDARESATRHFWTATKKPIGTVLPATPQGVPATTNIYDLRDWLSVTKDLLQRPTVSVPDAAGRVVKVIDPLLRTNTFGYDASGRRVGARNAANEETIQIWNGGEVNW